MARETRRQRRHIDYKLIWAAGGCALVLLMLQVLFRFELGPAAALVRMGDWAIALLYILAARRARAAVARNNLDPLPIGLDLWGAAVFIAVTGVEIALVIAYGSVLPGVSAASALGKAGIVVLAVSLRSRLMAREYSPTVHAVVLSPPATVATSFLMAITAGWMLLTLPEASASGHSIGALDALFTATSATCVTGLIVKDTPNDFSLFGLLVILALIQLGGLGIMTLAGMFGAARGQKTSMRQRMIVQDTLVAQDPHAIGRTLGVIALYSFVVEALGIALLYLRWVLAGEEPVRAAWLAVFHSISAFCNAGFSLFSNSLEDYSGDVAVNVIIAGLILIGGIGFPVVLDVWRALGARRRGERARLSLHSKMALVTSGYLLVIGFVGFWLLEWTGIMLRQGVQESFYTAFFQSVTPRTAGFNTVPMGQLAEATKFLMVMLMFIGASPGSTGGGIKTCTAAVIASVARAMTLGETHIHAFGRSIPEQARHRAVAILMLFGLCVLVWTFSLSISEGGRFINILFETVSAFGTVGLSTGVTPTLTKFGRVAIILAMYLGRVGPLTVTLAMAGRSRKGVAMTYAEESVMVG